MSEPSERLPESLRISRRRAKRLAGKLFASPFLPAFSATMYVETILPHSPWAWAGVFGATTVLFVLGHRLLDSLQSVQELADAQAQITDFGGDDPENGEYPAADNTNQK